MNIDVKDLMAYTAWERQKWYEWFRQREAGLLDISTGPDGDARIGSLREMMRHIFLVEMYYALRLRGKPLPDMAAMTTPTVEALFELGRQSRKEFAEWLETFPDARADEAMDFSVMGFRIVVSPRKAVTQVLLHEIRHWGQVGTFLRLNGHKDESIHDFLASPVMGGEFRPGPAESKP